MATTSTTNSNAPTGHVGASAQEVGGALADLSASAGQKGLPPVAIQHGVVQDISNDGGKSTLTITVGGSGVPVSGIRYLNQFAGLTQNYSVLDSAGNTVNFTVAIPAMQPQVGDTVLIHQIGNDLIVLGSLAE